MQALGDDGQMLRYGPFHRVNLTTHFFVNGTHRGSVGYSFRLEKEVGFFLGVTGCKIRVSFFQQWVSNVIFGTSPSQIKPYQFAQPTHRKVNFHPGAQSKEAQRSSLNVSVPRETTHSTRNFNMIGRRKMIYRGIKGGRYQQSPLKIQHVRQMDALLPLYPFIISRLYVLTAFREEIGRCRIAETLSQTGITSPSKQIRYHLLLREVYHVKGRNIKCFTDLAQPPIRMSTRNKRYIRPVDLQQVFTSGGQRGGCLRGDRFSKTKSSLIKFDQTTGDVRLLLNDYSFNDLKLNRQTNNFIVNETVFRSVIKATSVKTGVD